MSGVLVLGGVVVAASMITGGGGLMWILLGVSLLVLVVKALDRVEGSPDEGGSDEY